MVSMTRFPTYTRCQIMWVAIHHANIHPTWNHLHKSIWNKFKYLARHNIRGRLEDWIRLTLQTSWEQTKRCCGANHPGILRHESSQVPPKNHGAQPSANETLPSLVRTERDKLPMNEFPTTSYPCKPSKWIIRDNQHDRKCEPKKPIVNIMHDIFQLPNSETYLIVRHSVDWGFGGRHGNSPVFWFQCMHACAYESISSMFLPFSQCWIHIMVLVKLFNYYYYHTHTLHYVYVLREVFQ